MDVKRAYRTLKILNPFVRYAHDLPQTFDLVLLDGAKALHADILQRVEARLPPGSVVVAYDAHNSPGFVSRMRSDANRYLSVPLAGDLETSMRLS